MCPKYKRNTVTVIIYFTNLQFLTLQILRIINTNVLQTCASDLYKKIVFSVQIKLSRPVTGILTYFTKRISHIKYAY